MLMASCARRAMRAWFAKLQTLPGLPRAARPSGRFAEGKTPQRGNVRHDNASQRETMHGKKLKGSNLIKLREVLARRCPGVLPN